ncbi:hypothetical protein DFP72DRAFT_855654 [Ephemerocybe angulata]|uniref:Uncharacterized protein n=1 Tax=Ephemerocybe angulata TaxID=980116 RepID=A0A8H6HG63_9AGAR|nr:hypothetical protein DFP72DRAFT_855654 [Tulosesus angulatus]
MGVLQEAGETDYNEALDARNNADYLSTRDFAYDYQDLDAREPAAIEVPFHPSIRDFLEEAATMHPRGCFGDGRELITRVHLIIGPPVTRETRYKETLKVYKEDTGHTI